MCHSDLLYFKYDNLMASHLSFTMGHEYVAALARNACFQPTCIYCGVDADNLCVANWPIGFGVDGFYAPYCAVRAEVVVPAVANIQPGQTVLIIGAGGLGLNGIQIAKNVLGVKYVVACDIRDGSLVDARAAGADFTALPGAPALLADKKLVVDVACDFVGTNDTFNAALKAVRPKGTLQVIGFTSPTVDLPLIPAADKDLTVRFSMWGKLDELREVLGHIVAGKITPQVETRVLATTVETFEDFMGGRIKRRMVLIPEH
ncbi:hypothetical protein BD626DRAFT_546795 [Schizophyllum amplum]|uniref:Alcohol dehydrogenase-like C-terminal domain-containing protein n=1 Tax=Schizophyllum amplum TaxID=97359 RepID=A0A550CKF6_9AGAR|nr:hypothetical protein BD626DRAFT_546795 [Auriculariopsis ampla]